jgi:hypothetical protein
VVEPLESRGTSHPKVIPGFSPIELTLVEIGDPAGFASNVIRTVRDSLTGSAALLARSDIAPVELSSGMLEHRAKSARKLTPSSATANPALRVLRSPDMLSPSGAENSRRPQTN